MDREFSLAGREFKLFKIDAFKQFHIARRIGPILADLAPVLKGLNSKKTDSLNEDELFDQIAKVAGPVMDGLSQLSDKDAEFVLLGLLAAAEMKQSSGGWAHVAKGDLLMIQDLELPQMLQIAGRSFMYNLAGFFAAAPRAGA